MRDPLGHVLVNDRDPVEHFLVIYGRMMAISGGLIFIGLIAMSLISIVGRKLGFGSVTGDIELMQAGTAIAAFSAACMVGAALVLAISGGRTSLRSAAMQGTLPALGLILLAIGATVGA